MFGFLKKLFGAEESSLYTTPESESRVGIDKPKVTPTIDEKQTKKYSDIIGQTEGKETKAKPAQVKQEEPKKRGRKKAGITKTDLNKMTKDELEAYAKKEHKVDLDKRKKKADLVEEVLKLAK